MRTLFRHRLQLLIAFLVVASPGVAAACAVCFSGRTDEQRVAFGTTTVFLTFLPLVVLGAMIWWVRRRARELAADAAPAVAAGPNLALRAYSGTSIR